MRDSWFAHLTAHGLKVGWDVLNRRQEGSGYNFWEFYSHKVDYRTITLRRRNDSFPKDYIMEPGKPPVVWALWSHLSSPALRGYFEELAIGPENDLEMEFMIKMFESWLVKGEFNPAFELASHHPRFAVELPPHRKPAISTKADQLTKLVARMRQQRLEAKENDHKGIVITPCIDDAEYFSYGL